MKKFLISLFIVAIFSSVVFVIGLAPLRIKADSFGVLVSKTNGISSKPVENGVFDWRWELLLPTNSVIKTFSPKPYNVTKTVSGELPSGGVYTSLFNSMEKFDYKFTFTFSLLVSPENVIELLKQGKISNNDDLEQYMSGAGDAIAQMAVNFYLENAYKNPGFRPESVRRDEITRKLRLYEDYPEVELSIFALTECIFPDYNLYKQLQNQGGLIVQHFDDKNKNLDKVKESSPGENEKNSEKELGIVEKSNTNSEKSGI